MELDDLERRLKSFFQKNAKQNVPAENVRRKVLEAFSEQQKKPAIFQFLESILLHRKFTTVVVSVASVFVLFMLSSDFFEDTLAGTILPTFGPVEVIRDGETILVDKRMRLRAGDSVRVGNKAEAQIVFPNQLISTAKDRTTFQVLGNQSLFLEQGALENTVFRGAEIATERGLVESAPGAEFLVSVSESGETKVTPEKNWVHVFDLNERKVTLKAGEKLALRTDTILPGYDEIPGDLLLSASQIRAIRAKLVIARSKILTGVDHFLVDEKSAGEKDIASAEKTFRSIAQVLNTSRNLEITKRKNLAKVEVKDILPMVREKVENEDLLQEVAGVENLFQILEEHPGKIAFSSRVSGVESFDRYVLLKRIFALGTDDQQVGKDILLNKYVVAFLRKVQNAELRIDQISVLNEEVERLPKTELTREFLDRAVILFSPDIATILEEKLEKTF